LNVTAARIFSQYVTCFEEVGIFPLSQVKSRVRSPTLSVTMRAFFLFFFPHVPFTLLVSPSFSICSRGPIPGIVFTLVFLFGPRPVFLYVD